MDLELLKASKTGNVPLFLHIANQDPSKLLATTPQLNTVLHLAARYGHVEIMREALGIHPSLLTEPNSKGNSALHLAARAGLFPAVDFLLSEPGWGEVVVMKNKANYMALHEAVRSGQLEVVERFTCSQRIGFTDLHESPLYLAAQKGLLRVVRLLLKSPHRSFRGPRGETALHAAVVEGHFDIVKELLEDSPNLVKEGDEGKITPLHCAASLGNLKMARLFLCLDASTAYDLDNFGRSPIHMAASKGHTSIVQEIYCRCPGSVELLDSRSCNILHLAIIRRKARVVEYILEDPGLADLLNEKDIDGNSPLHLAVMSRSLSLVNLLCTHRGVDLVATNKNGQTSVDVAELQEEPSMGARKFRILRALRHAGVRRGKLEDVTRENVSDTPSRDPSLLEARRARANTLSLVATLVATVTFAAAYSLPGGYKNDGPDEGSATLIKKTSLQLFLLADTIAMCSSTTAAFMLISSATRDRDVLVRTLKLSTPLVWWALCAMVIAFVAGVCTVASESKWLVIGISVLGCSIPFTVPLLMSYIMPYKGTQTRAWKKTSKSAWAVAAETIRSARHFLPQYNKAVLITDLKDMDSTPYREP